jgi:CRP/FNR family transcriptional regulator, cyclic AMP receptor protein
MPVMLDHFRNATETKTFALGEVVFEVGTSERHMYAVRDGEIEIYFNEVLVETVGPGGFVGEKSLIDGLPHTTTAIAKTDVTVAIIDETKFLFLVHETPLFALQVMRVQAQRIRRLMQIAIGAPQT